MKSLTVELAERSYPIYIGENLYSSLQLIERLKISTQVLIVTNATVASHYLDRVRAGLRAVRSDAQIETVILPDGENYKNWETLNLIYDVLLQHRYERGCMLVALGGGVVGDMTGFAAATYQRGVSFIQLPTTLLSQVDSSVGGKTGINHPLGKNMIGAFYQPQSVIIDINTLNTLPDRELSAGLAEIIKYGLIVDEQFFCWLEKNMSAVINRDPAALTYVIERSCLNKALIVSSDERESGKRALLNLGHTFGHAIEAHQGYGRWLHGEAVSAGIMIAAYLSQRLGWLNNSSVLRIKKLLECAKLPVSPPGDMSVVDFYNKMQVDKKVENGKIRFILLKAIGNAIVTSDVAEDDVAVAITNCCA